MRSMPTLSRRAFLAAGAGSVAVAACAPGARSSTELAVPSLRSIRSTQGVPEALASCHTAMIGGYVLEGHVPAEDVRKLLAERPEAVGLAVPAMPLGSPGMETPDGQREPYETLLILKGGGTRVFARHG